MYRGNGNTRVFPLPAGEDGRVVYLVAGGRKVRLAEGEAYEVRDGNVVFGLAPPVGAEVAFGDEEVAAAEIPANSRAYLVLRADGTMEEVSEDPAVLLAEARGMLQEAKGMLKAAVSAQEAVRIIVAEEREIARESLSGRLFKYEEEVEKTVRSAASLVRDDVWDVVKSNLLEIRNKHKSTVAANDHVQELLKGAKAELRDLVDEATERMEAKCEPLLGVRDEVHSLVSEAREARAAARSAAASAGAEVAKTFGDRTEVVLEELRSLKATVSGEVKGAIEGAKAAMSAEIVQVRAMRETAAYAAKRCEEIERKIGTR